MAINRLVIDYRVNKGREKGFFGRGGRGRKASTMQTPGYSESHGESWRMWKYVTEPLNQMKIINNSTWITGDFMHYSSFSQCHTVCPACNIYEEGEARFLCRIESDEGVAFGGEWDVYELPLRLLSSGSLICFFLCHCFRRERMGNLLTFDVRRRRSFECMCTLLVCVGE